MRQAYEAALIKLQAAIPSTQRRDADFIRQRIFIDTPGWHTQREDLSCFAALQEAVLSDRRATLIYERFDHSLVQRLVDPLGLVAKGSLWYLVAAVEKDGAPDIRTYRVSRVQGFIISDQPCRRPPDFDLAAFWAQSSSDFVANLPRYLVTVRIQKFVLDRFQTTWRFGRVQQVDLPDMEGWCTAQIDFEVVEEATIYMAGLGPLAEVIAPVDLRARIRDHAAQTVAQYAEVSSP
jgi:predicted DNA-binding transcriptional regulator YafY